MSHWPFFTYYGGKWRIAKRYPAPTEKLLIEPFAGSAGYSVKWEHPKVHLFDLNERIIGVWQYLISATVKEINSLPLTVNHVDDLKICQEGKWLIGFWLNKGCVEPMKSPSAWMRSGIRPNSMWGEVIRNRISKQLPLIRGWKATLGSFADIPNARASWFIDPPYEAQGGLYTHNKIDYLELSEWCRSRSGQVMVCESKGARWLPFKEFYIAKGLEGPRGKKKIHELFWSNLS
jgi:D12 class N6 adenine-specific DNA methyltransferase